VNQSDDALVELEHAAILEPQNSRYQYVYAIALNTFGRTDEAINVLQASRQEFAGDFDIGWALITILRDAGRIDDARREALRLQIQYPENQDVKALLASFTSQ
jgi:predicted Zn-dependent protease